MALAFFFEFSNQAKREMVFEVRTNKGGFSLNSEQQSGMRPGIATNPRGFSNNGGQVTSKGFEGSFNEPRVLGTRGIEKQAMKQLFIKSTNFGGSVASGRPASCCARSLSLLLVYLSPQNRTSSGPICS